MGKVIAGDAPALGSKFAFAEKAVNESVASTVLELSSVADKIMGCTFIGLI